MNWVKLYKEHDFEIWVGIIICVILFISFVSWTKGKHGTWNSMGFSGYYHLLKKPATHSKGPMVSKGETECKRVLEKIFKRPFPKCRPDFLRNHITDGENNLELDCYNQELRLAVEYHGRQHFEYIPFFHRTKDAFYNQKYRDEMKRNMCAKNSIKLIEVDYKTRIEDIEPYLIRTLSALGYRM